MVLPKIRAQSSSTRIPANLWPEHYDIEIRPDFYPPLTPEQFFFDGWVTIYLRCGESTDYVYLHFKQMTINKDSIDLRDSANGRINVINISEDTIRQLLIIQTSRQLIANERFRVSLNFTGPIKRDLLGLYYSQYEEGGVTKWAIII